jgi:hypothetical protein
VCFVLVRLKHAGLPQLATPRRGFRYDVTFLPIDKAIFQILKILVGGFFPTIQQCGVLEKTRNNKICYFHGGCFIFVRNQWTNDCTTIKEGIAK